nr:putative ribonuclease H-like domain-containing protein [Tanacetum cinerariifolium]
MARTPQQNGVAERRNKTMIVAVRTMLADSKLPTIFWAEAVNTACYVQNKVLVVKPYFKTPYELFKGRSPTLSFMRPFGCHVLILNTLDQTRKVEENLHITFLENKPMIAGGGPEWLFDIDVLSKSMNYTPVFAGTNSNDFADKGASFDAGQSNMEIGSSQDYILMPLWKDNSLFDSSSQALDGPNKDKHGPSQASESDNQERPNGESSTKTVNTAGPLNIATPTYANYPNDPLMPDLEDARIFDDAYDDRDEGAEADYNNLETMEPKKVTQALDDNSWVDAIQEELFPLFLAYASFMDFTVYQMDVKSAFLYGTIKEEVYVSQPLGFVDPEFPNRVYKVEKALYGLHQAPRAWCETLSTYLVDNGFRRGIVDKTLFIKKIKDDILPVQVYVDDIIFGSIKRSWSTEFEQLMHKRFQMSSMGELTFAFKHVNPFDNEETVSLQMKLRRVRKDEHQDDAPLRWVEYNNSSFTTRIKITNSTS